MSASRETPSISSLYILNRSFKVNILKSRLSERKGCIFIIIWFCLVFGVQFSVRCVLCDSTCQNYLVCHSRLSEHWCDSTRWPIFKRLAQFSFRGLLTVYDACFKWHNNHTYTVPSLGFVSFFYWSKLFRTDLRSQYPKAHALIFLFRL